jgi:hypothetical protein
VGWYTHLADWKVGVVIDLKQGFESFRSTAALVSVVHNMADEAVVYQYYAAHYFAFLFNARTIFAVTLPS